MRKNLREDGESMPKGVRISEILEEKGHEWSLALLSGEKGLTKRIRTVELNRPGLLLAGFEAYFPFNRAQIIGKTELAFLETLPQEKREEAIERLYRYEFPVLFITRGRRPPELFLKLSQEREIPLIGAREKTTPFIHLLSEFLTRRLADQVVISGTLVDIYGVGILLTGKSGIGKSECALDLVGRGHVFGADD